MEIVKIEKRPTWTNVILGLKAGSHVLADWSDEGSIRPLISSSIKFRHPDREFKTSKQFINGNICLKIERIK